MLSNKPVDITLRLVSKLAPGHVVVGDNLFSSMALSKRLMEERGLFYLGTIRHMGREIPQLLKCPKGLPLYSTSFYFCGNNTLVSFIRRKNKNVLLLSNIHHEKAISSTPKQKPLVILDYNANKSGVDKLDQLLKEYRPYRTTRRWPCVIFFDLIAFATLASWVIFTIKYPNHILTTTKNRKKILFLLSIQLVTPLIRIRRESSNFRFLTSDVKDTINNLCMPKPKVQSSKSLADVPIALPSSSIPDSGFSLPLMNFHNPGIALNPSSIPDSGFSLPLMDIHNPGIALNPLSIPDPGISLPSIIIPDPGISLPSVTIPDPGFSLPSVIIPDPGINTPSGDASSTDTSRLIRIGRCFYCKKKNDKKTGNRCELCFTFICHNHSKTVFLHRMSGQNLPYIKSSKAYLTNLK